MTDGELVMKVRAAVDVISELVDESLPGQHEFPLSGEAAARLITAEVPELSTAALEQLLHSPEHIRDISIAVLGILGNEPVLAELIDDSYDRKTRQLDGGTMLLAGALVLFVLKLKSVRVTKRGKEISFYECSHALKELLEYFLKKPG